MKQREQIKKTKDQHPWWTVIKIFGKIPDVCERDHPPQSSWLYPRDAVIVGQSI